MFFSRKLLAAVPEFPIGMTAPGSYTTQTLVDLSNTASYQTGVFSDTGWYRVKIGAADGKNASSANGGKGGYASTIFFAYSGTKYLIWGCNNINTGYPNPSNKLGGVGGDGRGYSWHVPAPIYNIVIAGGYGGGSATSNGKSSSLGVVTYGTHSSGAGAGFICGMDETTSGVSTETETFNEEGYFSVDTVFTMVLAGGGGGAGADVNAYSSGSDATGGGGGGGAWGNGGNGGSSGSHGVGNSGGSGPGGTDGKGTNGTDSVTSSTAGTGGNGGWAIRDYTTNTFSYGSGANGRPAAQVCILEKLIY